MEKYTPIKYNTSMLNSALMSYGFRDIVSGDVYNVALITTPDDVIGYYHIGRDCDNTKFKNEFDKYIVNDKARRVHRQRLNKNPKKKIKLITWEYVYADVEGIELTIRERYPHANICVIYHPDYPTYDTIITAYVSSLK